MTGDRLKNTISHLKTLPLEEASKMIDLLPSGRLSSGVYFLTGKTLDERIRVWDVVDGYCGWREATPEDILFLKQALFPRYWEPEKMPW